MFKNILFSILLSVSAAAQAGIVAVAKAQEGLYLALWDDKKMCQGVARYAVFVNALEKMEGCWKTDGKVVQIAFLDGDVIVLPVEVFTKPEES